jgi:ABC-type lipoprotein export system ATPase subunit
MPVNLHTNIALSDEPLKQDTIKILNSIKLSELVEKEKLEHEKLSGGQRSRISLLRGIEFGASVILLDEPTSALDSEMKSRISSIVRSLAKNSIVIIVSHDDAFDSIASKFLEVKKQ